MSPPNFPDWLDILTIIIAVMASGVVGLTALFGRTVRQTVADQKELIDTLQSKVRALEDNQAVNAKTITDLQGKIAVVETLPLKAIAESQTSIVNMQKEMLQILQTIQEEIKVKE